MQFGLSELVRPANQKVQETQQLFRYKDSFAILFLALVCVLSTSINCVFAVLYLFLREIVFSPFLIHSFGMHFSTVRLVLAVHVAAFSNCTKSAHTLIHCFVTQFSLSMQFDRLRYFCTPPARRSERLDFFVIIFDILFICFLRVMSYSILNSEQKDLFSFKSLAFFSP